jgi:spore coat protein U-like protein
MEEAMKKSMTVFITLAVLAAGGAAWAADTNTLTVQASVTGTCKFVAATSALNFGALDPAIAVDVNGSTTTQFWCTKGLQTLVTLAADLGLNPAGGTRQMMDSVSTDLIPYSLTLTPDGGTNQGPASPRLLTISGTVLGANFAGKSEGNYSDTVLLTFTP